MLENLEEFSEGSIKGSGSDRKAQLKKAYRAGEDDTRNFNRPGGYSDSRPKGMSKDKNLKHAYTKGRDAGDGSSTPTGKARSTSQDTLRQAKAQRAYALMRKAAARGDRAAADKHKDAWEKLKKESFDPYDAEFLEYNVLDAEGNIIHEELDEDLIEDVEVETEESIVEDAEVEAVVEDSEEETLEEAAAPMTKAGMISAMYKHMSKLKKEDIKAAYESMMSSDDDEDEDEDEEDDDDMEEMYSKKKGKMKESYDFKADMDALISSDESLTEEFQTKAATIFEAAVKSKVAEEIDRLEEEYKVSLEEETATIKADLVEKVDGYLNYVVESWMEENRLAVENGLRTEIAESFMTALKGVFVEHYIDVPESKKDMVDDLVDQVTELEEHLNSATEDNIRLTETVHNLQRSEIIAEASKDLAATEVEKLKGLVEKVDFEDAETFAEKVATLKESYFAKPIVTTTEEIGLNDETDEVQLSGVMAQYASVLSQTLKK